MIYNKEKIDFRFAYKKKYDITQIKSLVEKLEKEWKEDTTRQDTFQVHRYTNSYILNKVSIDWEINTPLNEIYKNQDTELWNLTEPIVRELEKECDGKMGQVLYINLPAGKVIDPHEDTGMYLYYTCRHHIPIITNPGVGFIVDGETKFMQEGECWEINNNKTHSVFNKSSMDRIHLLIDIIPNKVLG